MRAQENANPRFGATRARLLLGRLSTASWNQYQTAMASFCEFCATWQPPIQLDQVTARHLVDYVCYLAERPKRLAAVTVASYLAGIRTVLRECGLDMGTDTNLAAVLAGYKRWTRSTGEHTVKRAAWLARYTQRAIDRATTLMHTSTQRKLTAKEHQWIVSAAMIAMAMITFSRGDTICKLLLNEVRATINPINIRLSKQKRPKDYIPDQDHQHGNSTKFLLRYLGYLRASEYRDASFLFGNTPASPKAQTLDSAVKLVAETLHIPSPTSKHWTGHCVRIGAISEAFAIGVPLARIAFFAGHRHTSTTEGYVRHDVTASPSAHLFFGHLVPLSVTAGPAPL